MRVTLKVDIITANERAIKRELGKIAFSFVANIIMHAYFIHSAYLVMLQWCIICLQSETILKLDIVMCFRGS